MKHTGTITLLYDEQKVAKRNYSSLCVREQVFRYWRLKYGGRFKYFSIQIRPDVFERKPFNTSRQLGKIQEVI